MGLNLRVNGKSCGQWSYSGFMEFRIKVATQVGINIYDMEGFACVDKNILKEQGWEAYEKAYAEELEKEKISWDTINDPIKTLLFHSDCDGEIPYEECLPLANRLEEIIKDWPQNINLAPVEEWIRLGYPPSLCIPSHDYEQAKKLIDGLRHAFLVGKPVKFC